MESGVHPLLHPNCYHQLIFATFNLKIFYPPPYERDIWCHQRANTDHGKGHFLIKMLTRKSYSSIKP